jgi:hypothetical protein
LQTCVSDRRSFCEGHDPNGRPYIDQPCEDTTIHSDCPPGPNLADPSKSARCIGNSGIDVNAAIASPLLTIALAVGVELDCGAVDPATGTAPCTCELRTAEPVVIPGIGVACMGRLGGCGSGEIDCEGGSLSDVALVHDHDVGMVLWAQDPNRWIVPLCDFPDPNNGNLRCEEMCGVYCADLAGDFIPLASGCEGYCRAGSREGLPCDFDLDCLDGDCVGGEGVPHVNTCGCQCIEVAGNPSRPGALTCQIGLFVLVESTTPCDGLDVTLTVASQCVPFTTESFTNIILNSNLLSNPLGPDSDRGQPVNCAELRAGAVSELTLVGNSTSFDSQLGDLSIPLRQRCDGLDHSCDVFDDGAANDSCLIGRHTCELDSDRFCVGDDPNGRPYVDQPCEDTISHSDCPPGPNLADPNKSARCIQDSYFSIHSLLGSPLVTLPLSGDVEITCDAVDPNTGKAPCDCELGEIEGVYVPGIGAACLVSGFELCPPGEIDCDGGNALDTEEIHDHDVGTVLWEQDPNRWILPLCNFPDPNNGNPRCEEMCGVYCASLEGSFAYFNSGCEGFCVEGPRDGLRCTFDVNCPDGSCPGGDPVAHRDKCNCSCMEVAGIPSRPGALHCNIRAGLNIEVGLPCDGSDVWITTIQPCVPFTTEWATGTLLQANAQAADKIGPLSASGTPTTCAALAADVSAGLDVVATISFIDTSLLDLVVQFRTVCQ